MNANKTLFPILATAILTAAITYFIVRPSATVTVPGGTRSLNEICNDYDTVVPPTLTSKMVRSMVAKYSATQLNNIQTGINPVPVDAKAIWFDIETLKKFLYHVEHNVAKNSSATSKTKLGVRIYYAAYPKNTNMSDLAQDQTDPNFTMNPAYENLHTLVMIPTISDGAGNNYDFNPLDVATYDGFTRMKSDANNPLTNDIYPMMTLGTAPLQAVNAAASTSNTTQTSNAINARNHGQLYPPDNSPGHAFN